MKCTKCSRKRWSAGERRDLLGISEWSTLVNVCLRILLNSQSVITSFYAMTRSPLTMISSITTCHSSSVAFLFDRDIAHRSTSHSHREWQDLDGRPAESVRWWHTARVTPSSFYRRRRRRCRRRRRRRRCRREDSLVSLLFAYWWRNVVVVVV